MKKRQSVWKKGLSLLVSGAMLLSLCPAGAWASGEQGETGPLASGGNRAIMLGTAQLAGGQASSVYFGNYYQSDKTGSIKDPVKWRILANNEDNNNRLFLLADQNLDVKAYEDPVKDGKWAECDLRDWLNATDGYANNGFMSNAFSNGEQSAIAVTDVYNATQSNGTDNPNPKHTTLGGANTKDKIFLLSIEEVTKEAYGFSADGSSEDEKRKSTDTAYAVRTGSHFGIGNADYWWLRSPGGWQSMAAYVMRNGVIDFVGAGVKDPSSRRVRPAFNLNLSAVLFTAAAEGGKSATGMDSGLTAVQAYTGNEWKLTLLDSSRSNFTASLDPSLSDNKVEAGGTVTISYSDAQTGGNEYVSAMLTDGSGTVLYYGRIAHTQSEAIGTANITIPSDLTSGSYTLKVFSEQYNGDKETDYASNFVDIALTVDGTGTGTTEPGQGGSDTSDDAIAPTLSNGEAVRTGEAEATVTFTSSKAGTYYYIVAESGADALTKEKILGVEGKTCANGKNTINLTGLEGTGEKYIYILAQDEANNTSQNVLKITIPAYKKPTLSPDKLDFGSLKVGYAEQQARTVTITNHGNYPITLTQPTAVQSTEEYFTISTLKTDTQTIDTLSSTQLTLNANETATFTVKPQTGHGAGEYSETISVYGNWSTSGGTTGGGTGGLDTDWDGDEEVEFPIQTYQLMTNGISDSGEGADVTLTLTARFTVVAPVLPALEVSAPDFDSVQTGYAQPEAQPITIKNTGDADAQITRVMVDNTAAFTITGSGDSVAAQNSIETWLVQPNAGLTEGTHTGTIAVIYDNGKEATATVSFTVSEKALYSVTVNDSYAAQSGAGSYAAGETVSIAAGERSGYRFAGWTSQDNVEFADASGANTTFTMPAEAITVTANWEKTGGDPEPAPQTYTIAVRAEPEEGGTVAVKSAAAEAAGGAFVSVALAKGTEVTVTAAPNAGAGYRFVCWMDAEDSEVSGKVSHTFTVTADCTLTAVFEQEPAPEPTPEPSPEPTPEPSPEPDPEPSPAPEAPMEDSADGDIEAFIGAAVTIGGGAAWMAYQYREALPIWKLAGVVLLADEAAGAAGAASAAAPVANATVALYQDGQLVKTLTTDANGLFAARLPKGTYEAVAIWEKDGVIHTARRELTAETLLDGRDTAVQQIVLTDKAEEPNG